MFKEMDGGKNEGMVYTFESTLRRTVLENTSKDYWVYTVTSKNACGYTRTSFHALPSGPCSKECHTRQREEEKCAGSIFVLTPWSNIFVN
jgi:hypothetical protein